MPLYLKKKDIIHKLEYGHEVNIWIYVGLALISGQVSGLYEAEQNI